MCCFPTQAYMERIHAPLLMNPLVQAIVVALFVTGAAMALVQATNDEFVTGMQRHALACLQHLPWASFRVACCRFVWRHTWDPANVKPWHRHGRCKRCTQTNHQSTNILQGVSSVCKDPRLECLELFVCILHAFLNGCLPGCVP